MKPRIAIGTLGGTITMTAQAGQKGVTSTLGAQALVSAIPELAKRPLDLQLQTLANVASGSIQFATLFSALAWANEQVQQGAQGIVLVQGTDTLEESAFFLDLYWQHAAPLVLTAAMRSPSQAGADGPANLLAAVQVASSHALRDNGVMVVMANEIHEAREVRKVHTTSPHAFSSPSRGKIGYVQENDIIVYRQSRQRSPLPLPTSTAQKVLLLENVLDEATDIYHALPSLSYHGLVLAGVGSGHVSQNVRNALIPVIEKMPVLMSSRTGAGSTTKATYGYQGAEIDLQQLGLIMMGDLCPRKARLLLTALLWEYQDHRKALEQALHRSLGV